LSDVSQWATTAAGNDTGSPPDNPTEGMAPSTVNDVQREFMAALARWYADLKGNGLTTGGSGNAYTLTTNTTHAALGDVPMIVFEADRANTGTATLDVDSLGAKTIKKQGDSDLISGDIQANQVCVVAYEGTADVYHLLSQPSSFSETDGINVSQAGLVQMFAGSSEPSGWKFCNGQELSRSTFSDLFNVIGTTFGTGDGSTTFNVPDLRDRSPLGTATMGSTDAGRVDTTSTALGDSGGADEHTLTTSEMPSHDHGGSTGNENRAGVGTVANAQTGGGGSPAFMQDLDNAGTNHSHSISAQGGGGAHNNMHPFLAINFIIKT